MHIVSVVSARPNFVKLSAIDSAIKKTGHVHTVIHTGQHYDPLFSDVFFTQLCLPQPAHNLGIQGLSRKETIEQTCRACLNVLSKIKPDVLLVYGDVNGAVGAVRAALECGITVAHVEAGLRSFDQQMPEEINRIEIDQSSHILLCSEESGVHNLENEQATGSIHLVGNTMINTLYNHWSDIMQTPSPKHNNQRFGVVTMHRPSNVDTKDAFTQNIEFLNGVADSISLFLPAHHRFTSNLEKFGLQTMLSKSITLLEPLGYFSFLKLVSDCHIVLTDSGGLQEEAVFMEKRCFTLRRNTERPSTILSGSNTLIDPHVPEDLARIFAYLEDDEPTAIDIPQYWDGLVGQRIVDVLEKECG